LSEPRQRGGQPCAAARCGEAHTYCWSSGTSPRPWLCHTARRSTACRGAGTRRTACWPRLKHCSRRLAQEGAGAGAAPRLLPAAASLAWRSGLAHAAAAAAPAGSSHSRPGHAAPPSPWRPTTKTRVHDDRVFLTTTLRGLAGGRRHPATTGAAAAVTQRHNAAPNCGGMRSMMDDAQQGVQAGAIDFAIDGCHAVREGPPPSRLRRWTTNGLWRFPLVGPRKPPRTANTDSCS
jgi:hypothetical protein